MKFKFLIITIFSFFAVVLIKMNTTNHNYYQQLLSMKTAQIVYGKSPQRGRILDRYGNVLVDNTGILNIVYHKNKNLSYIDELKIAEQLTPYLNEAQITEKMKQDYYLLTNNNGDDLITKEEKELFNARKLTTEEIEALKKERIPSLTYTEMEEKKIYLYYLMNEGYFYEDKYLFMDISEEQASKIIELNLPQITMKVTSKRIYPYEETLKSIFGTVGNIPKEKTKEYLNNGYSLNDIVGTSGLEQIYDDVLKGKKAKYQVNDDYSLTLLEREEKGSDLYLNIDISLQMILQATLKEELIMAKKKKQTLYFHDAYSIIGEPLTGNILAISGLRYSDDKNFYDITPTMLTSSFAMGSVVKGASSTVGYQTNAITIGQKILDSCVKLHSQPSKCSYKRLGYVDDITALKTSSNYFQFITAIKSTGNTYHYNMDFNVTLDNFNSYRQTFATYGLGSLTNIDLPNEKIGMIGEKISGDLLLNLSIGQYDTYTPLELFQYINTIASRGKRMQLNIAKKNPTLLNEVNLDNMYYDRIIEGFYEVFHGGTATSYANFSLDVAGKTGTSETFYDSDQDNVVDTKTINSTVALFYPKDNPKYSMIVIAPNITNTDKYTYPFTKNISLKMTNHLTNAGY